MKILGVMALFFAITGYGTIIPEECTQLVVVRTENWGSQHGKMQAYKKSAYGSKWLPVTPVIDIVVGKQGLGWGIGLVDFSHESGPVKREGDRKGPAGIFPLGLIFAKKEMSNLSLPFTLITPTLEAVDDPESKYYNQIVDRLQVEAVDWNSSEKMDAIDLYDIGIEVLHNSPPKDMQAGSAIFIHRWKTPSTGTAGCTAMTLQNVEGLAHWLKKEAHPLLVQLPESEFERLQTAWALPSFIGK